MPILSQERKEERPDGRPPCHEAVAGAKETRVSAYVGRKRILDCLLAAALLIPGLPVIGLLVLLVRLTSRGPGIFRQTRVGLNGNHFTLLKIRTMTVDAEAGSGAVWAKKKDPRATRIGGILRKLHLDEFPQLLNVIRGEMSLVGPRPERPEFVKVLDQSVPRYRDRLLVPPGVTGLAQLNLPPDTDLCSVCRKLALDLDYVEHAGLSIDLRVIVFTITWLLRISGDRMLSFFGLLRTPYIAHCQISRDIERGEANEAVALDPHSLHCEVTRRMNGNGAPLPIPESRPGSSGRKRLRVAKPR